MALLDQPFPPPRPDAALRARSQCSNSQPAIIHYDLCDLRGLSLPRHPSTSYRLRRRISSSLTPESIRSIRSPPPPRRSRLRLAKSSLSELTSAAFAIPPHASLTPAAPPSFRV